MKRDKKLNENHENMEGPDIKNQNSNKDSKDIEEKDSKSSIVSNENESQELLEIKTQLENKSKQCDDYVNAAQRIAAEFDNFKKRTAREKENLCSDTIGDVVLTFLPVLDNLERAIQASTKEDDKQALKDGIEMVCRQIKDVMKSLGVEEINCIGEKFDPQLHNAVMHIDDDLHGENEVIDQFQKGYAIKEKVIRHSMVKVAN